MTDQKNLILAIIFSVGIILLFQVFYEMPRLREEERLRQLQETSEQQQQPDAVVRPAPSDGSVVPGMPLRLRDETPNAPPAATVEAPSAGEGGSVSATP